MFYIVLHLYAQADILELGAREVNPMARTASKTANINIRIDPEIKANAEKLFASFGITVTDAINIFLHKSLMEGGLPFEMKQPRYNKETEAAIQETRAIMSGQIQPKQYASAHALFDELDKEKDGE